jgi:hypothetical protein
MCKSVEAAVELADYTPEYQDKFGKQAADRIQ